MGITRILLYGHQPIRRPRPHLDIAFRWVAPTGQRGAAAQGATSCAAQAGLIFIVTGGSLLCANIVAVSDEFDAAVQPLRANLLALLGAARDLREHHGALPMAASPAMAELAGEPDYVGGWRQQPVESAHSWAGLLIAAV